MECRITSDAVSSFIAFLLIVASRVALCRPSPRHRMKNPNHDPCSRPHPLSPAPRCIPRGLGPEQLHPASHHRILSPSPPPLLGPIAQLHCSPLRLRLGWILAAGFVIFAFGDRGDVCACLCSCPCTCALVVANAHKEKRGLTCTGQPPSF